MEYGCNLEEFSFGSFSVKCFVPVFADIHRSYSLQKKEQINAPFPYWAQIWPAAKALCGFLAENPQLVRHQNVLEIAAGLGLPSLLAARFAKTVCCSDLHPDAVRVMQRSIEESGLKNIHSVELDWSNPEWPFTPDVLLLSDINYDPASFQTLYRLIVSFLDRGVKVLITTPQRLVAKSFIEQLLPFSIHHEERTIIQDEMVYCTVMVLSQ